MAEASGNKKRILFVGEAVTLAHVARPLVLAQALNPACYEIHFACAACYHPFVRDTNFTYWPIDSISPLQFLQTLAKGGRLYDERTLSKYIQSDIELLDKIRPDFVVGDFRLSLAVSAPLSKVPYAAITNAHWSPFSTIRHPPLPEHPLARIIGVPLASALFSLIYPVVFAQHAQPLNRLRQKYGLTPLGGLQHVYTHGDYTLYADIPSLVQTRHLPPNHSYLGPLLWSPPVAHPEWWDSLPKSCPHIYITLGSSGQSEILPLIIEAIANLPVVAMVATAGRKDIAGVPGKVWGANFLPGMEAARRSALVICNGGSATVYQALSAGVPVLGVASNMDQYLTMKCLCEAGAGKLVRAGQATVAHLRKAITEMLFDESYRQCSKRLALECQQYNARERFAALVESWFK